MIFILKKKLRSYTHKSMLLKRVYLLLNRVKMYFTRFLSDDIYAKIKYKENTGLLLNLDSPVLFNEKLWWLKINYRIPLMTQCSDKIEVRKYIKKIGLEHILNDTYGFYDSFSEIPFNKMDGRYFIKCNHGSGTNALFDSKKPFDFEKMESVFNSALKSNYYYQSREWNYKNIKPRIIVEKYIESTTSLLDYRFFCFHGEAKLIFVDIDTAAEDGSHNPSAKRNIYDRDFKLQSYTVGRENFDINLVSKPDNLDVMLDYVQKISSPFIFCRVDLYNVNGEIYFGEITFYPGGATQQFSSKEKDLEISSWINLG